MCSQGVGAGILPDVGRSAALPESALVLTLLCLADSVLADAVLGNTAKLRRR